MWHYGTEWVKGQQIYVGPTRNYSLHTQYPVFLHIGYPCFFPLSFPPEREAYLDVLYFFKKNANKIKEVYSHTNICALT